MKQSKRFGKSFVTDLQNAVAFIQIHPESPPRLGQFLCKFILNDSPIQSFTSMMNKVFSSGYCP